MMQGPSVVQVFALESFLEQRAGAFPLLFFGGGFIENGFDEGMRETLVEEFPGDASAAITPVFSPCEHPVARKPLVVDVVELTEPMEGCFDGLRGKACPVSGAR